MVLTDEILVQCPKCKVMETLFACDGIMDKTLRFVQRGSEVYHLCGSEKPCVFLGAQTVREITKEDDRKAVRAFISRLREMKKVESKNLSRN